MGHPTLHLVELPAAQLGHRRGQFLPAPPDDLEDGAGNEAARLALEGAPGAGAPLWPRAILALPEHELVGEVRAGSRSPRGCGSPGRVRGSCPSTASLPTRPRPDPLVARGAALLATPEAAADLVVAARGELATAAGPSARERTGHRRGGRRLGASRLDHPRRRGRRRDAHVVEPGRWTHAARLESAARRRRQQRADRSSGAQEVPEWCRHSGGTPLPPCDSVRSAGCTPWWRWAGHGDYRHRRDRTGVRGNRWLWARYPSGAVRQRGRWLNVLTQYLPGGHATVAPYARSPCLRLLRGRRGHVRRRLHRRLLAVLRRQRPALRRTGRRRRPGPHRRRRRRAQLRAWRPARLVGPRHGRRRRAERWRDRGRRVRVQRRPRLSRRPRLRGGLGFHTHLPSSPCHASRATGRRSMVRVTEEHP